MNNMKRIISIISIALIMTACSEKNPFLAEWDTPYGIPPYEEIEVGDYIPARRASSSRMPKSRQSPPIPTLPRSRTP